MIQQLLDGLYDVLGVDRMPVKHPRPKKPKYSDYVQLSLFDALKEWAEKQLDYMYSLYSQYSKDLKELKNPLSRLSKMFAKKREQKLFELDFKVRFYVTEIAEFSYMWGLI